MLAGFGCFFENKLQENQVSEYLCNVTYELQCLLEVSPLMLPQNFHKIALGSRVRNGSFSPG